MEREQDALVKRCDLPTCVLGHLIAHVPVLARDPFGMAISKNRVSAIYSMAVQRIWKVFSGPLCSRVGFHGIHNDPGSTRTHTLAYKRISISSSVFMNI